MPTASKQIYSISKELLMKLAGQDTIPGVREAWNAALAIRDADGRPVCYYSKFSGFSVLDDLDPKMTQDILSLQQRSKPYIG